MPHNQGIWQLTKLQSRPTRLLQQLSMQQLQVWLSSQWEVSMSRYSSRRDHCSRCSTLQCRGQVEVLCNQFWLELSLALMVWLEQEVLRASKV